MRSLAGIRQRRLRRRDWLGRDLLPGQYPTGSRVPGQVEGRIDQSPAGRSVQRSKDVGKDFNAGVSLRPQVLGEMNREFPNEEGILSHQRFLARAEVATRLNL